eukprot:GHVL01028465.1.p1 GENE.GHVL01028465.1~~GHVL01028465.1.p1  ORF type:complete len:334 (-),score=55.11 GHVL01028465.1:508-1509(-)
MSCLLNTLIFAYIVWACLGSSSTESESDEYHDALEHVDDGDVLMTQYDDAEEKAYIEAVLKDSGNEITTEFLKVLLKRIEMLEKYFKKVEIFGTNVDLFLLLRKKKDFDDILKTAHALEFLLFAHHWRLPPSGKEDKLSKKDHFLLKLRDAKNLVACHIGLIKYPEPNFSKLEETDDGLHFLTSDPKGRIGMMKSHFKTCLDGKESELLRQVKRLLQTIPSEYYPTKRFIEAFKKLIDVLNYPKKYESKPRDCKNDQIQEQNSIQAVFFDVGQELTRLDSALKVYGPQTHPNNPKLEEWLHNVDTLNQFLALLADAIDSIEEETKDLEKFFKF